MATEYYVNTYYQADGVVTKRSISISPDYYPDVILFNNTRENRIK